MTGALSFAPAHSNALRLCLLPALRVLCHGGNDLLRKLDEDAVLKKILADNELKSDLVHPNAKGYTRLAQAAADFLKASGAL